MYNYFIKRILHEKNFYISIIVGSAIAILHIIRDVLPYTDPSLGHCVYTKWIESYSISTFTSLLFMLMPILSGMVFSHVYRKDISKNYFHIINSKGKSKNYSRCLFICNFIVGGLVFVIPLLLNLYICFLLLPNRKINFLLDSSNAIPLIGKTSLFPELYYSHPLLHVFIYITLDFLVAAVFASLALAFSLFIKNQFIIWISPFIFCYIYNSIVTFLIPNGANAYCPTYFSVQASDGISPSGCLFFLLFVFLLSLLIYLWGVCRNEYI